MLSTESGRLCRVKEVMWGSLCLEENPLFAKGVVPPVTTAVVEIGGTRFRVNEDCLVLISEWRWTIWMSLPVLDTAATVWASELTARVENCCPELGCATWRAVSGWPDSAENMVSMPSVVRTNTLFRCMRTLGA